MGETAAVAEAAKAPHAKEPIGGPCTPCAAFITSFATPTRNAKQENSEATKRGIIQPNSTDKSEIIRCRAGACRHATFVIRKNGAPASGGPTPLGFALFSRDGNRI